jgi:hypothetical protein
MSSILVPGVTNNKKFEAEHKRLSLQPSVKIADRLYGLGLNVFPTINP